MARAHQLFRIVLVLIIVLLGIFLWEISLSRPSGAKGRLTKLYQGAKLILKGERNGTSIESSQQLHITAMATINKTESYDVTSTTAYADICNSTRYSLPHNQSIQGIPFNMDQSTINILRNILANQTFKRKTIKFDSLETLPEVVPVSGASSNHFGEFKARIPSFLTHFPGVKLVFYDLGLKEDEIAHIKGMQNLEYRKFDFSQYPPHVKNLVNYAWKPLLIQHLLAEFDGVMWFDTSVRFERNMNHIRGQIVRRKTGFLYYAVTTGHSIVAATFPRMLEYFPMERNASFANMPQASALIVLNTAEAQQNIMKWVITCVINVDCIAAKGSKLSCGFNFPREKFGGCHRYDQSLFSILVSNAYNGDKSKYLLEKNEVSGIVQRG